MEQYKLIHSLSTADSIVKRNNVDLFMHASYFFLSCLYAKINGFHITLHTDEFGAELLKHAPYNEIIIDIKKPEGLSDKFFAWPKFVALENSPIDAIHIDGDVILRSLYLKDLLWKPTDCICQCEENKLINKLINKMYGKIYNISAEAMKDCWYPEWANRECNIMYNTSVIGLFNNDLRKEWMDTYWKMTKEYKEKGNYIEGSCHDIIVEQQFLRDLIIKKDYSCNFVIDEKEDFDKMNLEASSKGYLHVMNDKRRMLESCLQNIIMINPFLRQEILRMQFILGINKEEYKEIKLI